MSAYRVSWINAPDGRIIESFTFEARDDAEACVREKFPLIDWDELLVFEVSPPDDEEVWKAPPGTPVIALGADDNNGNREK